MAEYEIKDGVGIIPETETVLSDYAFSGKDVVSVVIPDSVKKIGECAFRNNKSLQSVVFSNSLEEIGENAFEGCESLTEVVLPGTLKKIQSCAFYGCTNLKSINLPVSLAEIGSNAFANCTSLTGIALPEKLKVIGKFAFDKCDSLTSLVVPKSTKTIGEYAFSECSSLTEISILGPVKELESVCRQSSALESVTLGEGIKSISDDSFSEWVPTGIVTPDGIKMGKVVPIGALKAINVPAGTIDYYKDLLPEKIHGLLVEYTPVAKKK